MIFANGQTPCYYLTSQTLDTNNAATATEQSVPNADDLLPREPCLQALAALRHAKWFQVCFFSLLQMKSCCHLSKARGQFC